MLSKFTRSIMFIVLLGLGACASAPNTESSGEFFDSSLITAKIKSRLVDDPLTSVFRIKVNTYKGVVQLSGFVNTLHEKQRAEVIAYSVEGVKKVENSLLLTPIE